MIQAPPENESVSNFLVSKGPADYSIFDYTETDFEQEFLPMFDEVSVEHLSHEEISGFPVVTLGLEITENTVDVGMLRCYYIVGDSIYVISATANQTDDGEYGAVFAAIMESYEIIEPTEFSSESTASVSFDGTEEAAIALLEEYLTENPLVEGVQDELFVLSTELIAGKEYYRFNPYYNNEDSYTSCLVDLLSGEIFVWASMSANDSGTEYDIEVVPIDDWYQDVIGGAPMAAYGISTYESEIAETSGSMQVNTPNGSSLRLREGPGTEYDVIMEIPNGEVVLLEDGVNVDGWLNVTYVFSGRGYESGWVSAEYLVRIIY